MIDVEISWINSVEDVMKEEENWIKYFISKLKEKYGEEIKKYFNVEYEDERLTTVIAHDILSNNNVKGKKRKANVDAVSAVVILQSFIDKRKSN